MRRAASLAASEYIASLRLRAPVGEDPSRIDEAPAPERGAVDTADAERLGGVEGIVRRLGQADITEGGLIVGDAAAIFVNAVVRKVEGAGIDPRIAIVAIALRGGEAIAIEIAVRRRRAARIRPAAPASTIGACIYMVAARPAGTSIASGVVFGESAALTSHAARAGERRIFVAFTAIGPEAIASSASISSRRVGKIGREEGVVLRSAADCGHRQGDCRSSRKPSEMRDHAASLSPKQAGSDPSIVLLRLFNASKTIVVLGRGSAWARSARCCRAT